MLDFGVVAAVLTAVVVFVMVMAPFFVGKGGMLAAASAIKSRDQLTEIKRALAKRYLRDEQAFQNKEISARAWRDRQEFLLRRFMDAARRLDYLEHTEESQGESA